MPLHFAVKYSSWSGNMSNEFGNDSNPKSLDMDLPNAPNEGGPSFVNSPSSSDLPRPVPSLPKRNAFELSSEEKNKLIEDCTVKLISPMVGLGPSLLAVRIFEMTCFTVISGLVQNQQHHRWINS